MRKPPLPHLGQASTLFGIMKYMKQERQPAETRIWLPPAAAAVSVEEVDEREVTQELAVSTLSSSSSLPPISEQLSSEEESCLDW